MMRTLSTAPLLHLVLAALLARSALAEIRFPGDPRFYRQLRSLSAASGVLQPPFSPEVFDYTLVVEDAARDAVTIFFALDLAKYSTTNLPAVRVGGRQFAYSPIDADANRHEVLLNQSLGPFDETVRITVADPRGASGMLSRASEHTYAIRVLQSPQIERITAPRSVTLASLDGRLWQAEPSARTYSYVTRGSDVFRLRVACAEWASALLIDGEEVNADEVASVGTLVALSHLHAGRSIQCLYRDSRWAPYGKGEIYQVQVRGVVDLTELKVALVIPATEGYCALRVDRAEYFRCRVAADMATFVATFSDTRLVGRLRADNGVEHVLFHGVAEAVRLPTNASRLTLVVEGGEEPREWPVEVVRAARCRTMQCPRGLVHRPSSEGASLCAGAACAPEDAAACCMEAPRCDTLRACPAGTVLRSDAAEVACGGAACEVERDAGVCCQAPATCDTFACGAGHRRVRGAEGIACSSAVCGVSDADRCCEACGDNSSDCASPMDFTLCPRCEGAVDPRGCCDDAVRASERAAIRRSFWAARSAHYEAVGCFPEAINKCAGHECHYDEGCASNPPRAGGLGCFAAGVDRRCRFCGFGHYPPCPEETDCFDTFRSPCEDWSDEKFARCRAKLDVRCPARERKAQDNTLMMKDAVIADAAPLAKARSARGAAGVAAGFACAAVLAVAATARLRRPRPEHRALICDAADCEAAMLE